MGSDFRVCVRMPVCQYVIHTHTCGMCVKASDPRFLEIQDFSRKKTSFLFCIFSRAKASEARFAGVSVHAPCHAMVHTLWYK